MNVIHRARHAAIVGALMVALALLAACTSDDGDTAPEAVPTPEGTVEALTLADVTEPGPYEVSTLTYDLVDTSRETAANGGAPRADERRLTTTVWYPVAPGATRAPDNTGGAVDLASAPYPLIIFAHGLSSSRLFSPDYTTHLASHGYIVAAPDFPLTRIGAPGGVRFDDVVNQAGDVSFVIDRMLDFNTTSGHELEGTIDPETIGLTGHSAGGFTTLITVYGVYGAGRDERIDAALPISASGCFYDEDDVGDVAIPMMFLTGSEDLIVPRAGNRAAYDNANAPRYWVEINGANHVRFSFADIDDAVVAGSVLELATGDDDVAEEIDEGDSCGIGHPDPLGATPLTLGQQHEALRTYALPFFDAHLKGDQSARQFLTRDLPALPDGVASYEFEQ